MSMFAATSRTQTGSALAAEYDETVASIRERANARDAAVHQRLAELEEEERVLHGLLNQIG